jgi:hypothetical protein
MKVSEMYVTGGGGPRRNKKHPLQHSGVTFISGTVPYLVKRRDRRALWASSPVNTSIY